MLLLACGGLVISEIHRLVSSNVATQSSPATGILALYCFVFILSFKATIVRIAFAVMGASVAIRVALRFFSDTNPVISAIASVLNLFALVVIFIAIVQWFRSVVRWNRSSAS